MTNATTAKRKRRMAREPKAEASSTQDNTAARVEPAHPNVIPPKPQKTEKVLEFLKRTEGATLDDLVEATGWLPHTTRAALTGLKKKGHTIERTKVDGVSRYAVVEPGAQ
jgi:threonine dehydrogenase-like Zn-dependent dehydrogenase